jgi:hypothetical protein
VILRARPKPLIAAIVAVSLATALAACSSGTSGTEGESGPAAWQSSHDGVTATIPAGWHRVPLANLPGAEVPLQVASAAVDGSVLSKICGYPRAIMGQLPSDGALLQVLEASGVKLPPLPRPFHLGQPEGHECGEAYNVFFRKAGRAFQLRIWSAPSGPSPKIRTQIERLIDGLRVAGMRQG